MNDKIIQENSLIDVDDYLKLQQKVAMMTESMVSLAKIVSDQGSDIMHMLSIQDRLMRRVQETDNDYQLLAARFKKCPPDELN